MSASWILEGVGWVGVTVLPPGLAYDALGGDRVGGVSGLVEDPVSGLFVGIVDDRERPRLVSFSVTLRGTTPEVRPHSTLALDFAGRDDAPPMLDGEALVQLPDGDWLVASEGHAGASPRVPPGIYRFDRNGRFREALAVPERFVPEPEGPQRRGVRDNAAFESLTLAPGGAVLFTAAEAPLVQDAERPSFGRGGETRLVEYVRQGEGFVPAREFVYALEPVAGTGFDFEPNRGENGLVELLAIGGDELLALERAFVQEAARGGRSANVIRLFHVTLDGATDVSALPSLRGATYRRASKRLLLDLSTLAARLPPELARLENFEALAFGPRGPDGRATLLVASDDNFNPRQRTAFVVLGGR